MGKESTLIDSPAETDAPAEQPAAAETIAAPAPKKWRYMYERRTDLTHFDPHFGYMDRDTYNGLILGGNSSPFQMD